MDLTSLSSNLPRNNSAHPEDPTEDEDRSPSTLLMSAFKQAAYSVTTLYKQANEQVDRARRDGQKDGYQECLDDIFSLLQRLEENGKADPATRELFKQWALGKRRKLGPRATTREEREASSESDVERHRSSSPTQAPQQQEQQPRQQEQHPQQQQPSSNLHPSQEMRMNSQVLPSPAAPYVPPALPQLPAFSFQSTRHLPPPPDTSDIELPDNDSPPLSPRMPPPPQSHLFQHGGFQQHKAFPHTHATNNTRGRRVRGNNGARQGTKRRMETIDDFFDLAGLEKMQQHHSNKKGRFQ